MSKEILDAAVLKQFKDYLETKGKIFEALSMDELDHEQESYIDQKFPGSKGLPNKMVEMMSSPSPSQWAIVPDTKWWEEPFQIQCSTK